MGRDAQLAEVIATFGLVTIIISVVYAGRVNAVPVAVAGYVGAAPAEARPSPIVSVCAGLRTDRHGGE